MDERSRVTQRQPLNMKSFSKISPFFVPNNQRQKIQKFNINATCKCTSEPRLDYTGIIMISASRIIFPSLSYHRRRQRKWREPPSITQNYAGRERKTLLAPRVLFQTNSPALWQEQPKPNYLTHSHTSSAPLTDSIIQQKLFTTENPLWVETPLFENYLS